MIGNNSQTFKIIFDRGMLRARYDLLKEFRKANFKRFIQKIFGIYDIYDAKVLSEPKQIDDTFEYKLKILKIRKYFLWINYANRTWN